MITATTRAHRIIPANCGDLTLGEHHLLGDPYSDSARVPFALYSFIVRCDNRQTAVIDLGPKTVEYCNNMFRGYGFLRASGEDDIVQTHGNAAAHLLRLGVRPEDVEHVIFTHFHCDHHGMDTPETAGACLDFSNANFHASKHGWDYNVERRADDHWNTYLDWAFGDFLQERAEAGRANFTDDAEIAPGIRTIFLGGHSPCSQAVRIETAFGPAIITSDEIYTYDLLERGAYACIYTTPANLIAATDHLVALAIEEEAILLPCHDPVLWHWYEESGDDWLRAAKIRTVQAAHGYRERRMERVAR